MHTYTHTHRSRLRRDIEPLCFEAVSLHTSIRRQHHQHVPSRRRVSLLPSCESARQLRNKLRGLAQDVCAAVHSHKVAVRLSVKGLKGDSDCETARWGYDPRAVGMTCVGQRAGAVREGASCSCQHSTRALASRAREALLSSDMHELCQCMLMQVI
jgi:hypothetical protein